MQRGERFAPPHNLAIRGEFCGYVWTIPSSKYMVTEAIINWPPETEGPRAVATKSWASLKGSTLFLAKCSGLQDTYLVPVKEVDLTTCKYVCPLGFACLLAFFLFSIPSCNMQECKASPDYDMGFEMAGACVSLDFWHSIT